MGWPRGMLVPACAVPDVALNVEWQGGIESHHVTRYRAQIAEGGTPTHDLGLTHCKRVHE